jgi:hypothetical protein
MTPTTEAPKGASADEAAAVLARLLGQSGPDGVLSIEGESVTVGEFRLSQLPEVIRLTADVLDAVRAIPPDDPLGWLRLFEIHTEDLVTLMALATGKPESWVSDLGLSDAASLLERIFRVNSRFFFQRLAPLFGGLGRSLPTAPPPSNDSGPTASPPLSDTGTA